MAQNEVKERVKAKLSLMPESSKKEEKNARIELVDGKFVIELNTYFPDREYNASVNDKKICSSMDELEEVLGGFFGNIENED